MSLSEDDIEIGFWRFGFADGKRFHPETTPLIPEDIQTRERISFNFSAEQHSTEAERKKLRKAWLTILPGLDQLKYIWTGEKVNQEFFEVLCQVKNLEGLWMKWTSITDLASIAKLTQLKHLFIGSSSKITDPMPLASLKNLVTLHTESLKKITDFSFLKQMKGLEGLIIEGDMWTPQTMDSLEPVGHLKNLRYFKLVGVKVLDKDISPVTKLKKLENLDLHDRWMKEDYEKAFHALPLLKYGDVKEFGESELK